MWAFFLQALSGGTSFQTLLIEEKCKKQGITILINSGSTHNFVDHSIAKKIGCEVIPTYKLMMIMANGSNINTTTLCPVF